VTAAEWRALVVYAAAGSVKEAAHELERAESTVKNQLRTLRQKLGVQTNVQAFAEGVRRGVIVVSRVEAA